MGQEGEDEDPGGEDSGDEGSGEKDDEEEVGPMDTKPLNLRVTWPAMSMAPQLAGKGVGELLDKVVIEPLSVQVRTCCASAHPCIGLDGGSHER